MGVDIFKRKRYDRLLEWKREPHGQTAVLVEGARRVGAITDCVSCDSETASPALR